MGSHPTWTIMLGSLLFVAFPKIMLGTEYGIIVDGKLTKHGVIETAGDMEKGTLS